MELDGKVAIVTGGASGIGEATVALFHANGARVLLVDRDAERAARTAAHIDPAGDRVVPLAADVSRAEDAERAVAEAVARYGRLDILVNNAGFGIRADVVGTAEADWDALMAVNVKGVFLFSRAAIPVMAGQGGGVIVNTASNAALVAIRERAAYVASKGAVAALTRAMAVDHADQKIRVNAVAPGTTWSPYFDEILASHEDPEGFVAGLNARAPMNRTAAPREIAEAILWLASERSSYATGSVMVVDGGMTAW
ncbi:SDR family oxidoreductase [Pseudooceanicola sp. GBMRC 2024]|uniref:SDR family oxidoreductase n=1 Tax=Pseudooceanicola albus TaxID=2692189 RepID=A0A6L7G1L9_9RHOB|nr:SDR family oxidoreductase [Pseudooceanicola albus]MXN17955.1 SDR family oxidoreductase [Pseudooceanicola albus]